MDQKVFFAQLFDKGSQVFQCKESDPFALLFFQLAGEAAFGEDDKDVRVQLRFGTLLFEPGQFALVGLCLGVLAAARDDPARLCPAQDVDLAKVARQDVGVASPSVLVVHRDGRIQYGGEFVDLAMLSGLVRDNFENAESRQIPFREALAVLPVSSRAVRVLLHPEDAELVREAYALGDGDLKWQVVEDPVIQHGGCKVLTETSQIDATVESRLNAVIWNSTGGTGLTSGPVSSRVRPV